MKGTEHARERRQHSTKFTLPTCQHNFAPAGSFFFFWDAEHVRQECCLATGGELPEQGSAAGEEKEEKGEGRDVALIAPLGLSLESAAEALFFCISFPKQETSLSLSL